MFDDPSSDVKVLLCHLIVSNRSAQVGELSMASDPRGSLALLSRTFINMLEAQKSFWGLFAIDLQHASAHTCVA
jgi:hypothetical protein